jgi:hypothetical protein
MAADDAAVVVTLRANLKDYETALKSAVRATERAAKAAESAISNIGKKAPAGQQIAQNFAKSAGQIQNDARMLQFQLNDIFSGLASGQGIRAVQQQLGQIAQQISGGSLAAGARTLGAAFVGMINPINLAVVAFGFAATAAASYFSGAGDGAEETAKDLQKHRDLIRDVAKTYGDALPALKAFNDYLDAQEGNAKQLEGLDAAIKSAGDELKKILQSAGTEGIDKVLGLFKNFEKLNIKPVIAQWEEFKKHVEDGTVTIEESEKMATLLNKTLHSLPVKSGDDLATGFMKVLTPIQALIQHVRDLNTELKTSADEIADIINKAVPLGSIGAPVVSGAGRLNPSQTELAISAGTADIEITRALLKSKAVNKQIAESLDNLTDDAVRAFGKLFMILPESAQITSGVRTRAEQAAAYARYRSGKGGLAAPPGTSRHEIGGALDIGAGVDMATLKRAVDGVKELTTLKGKAYAVDKVHVQLLSQARAAEDAEADAIEKKADALAAAQQNLQDYLSSLDEQASLQQRINEINASGLSADEKTTAIAVETELQKALNVAKQNDLTLTEKQIALIRQKAIANATADIAAQDIASAAKLQADALKDAQRAAEDFQRATQAAVGGLIKDLIAGKDAAEAFSNALQKIADKAIDMAIQNLFSMGGPGGAGGLLGGMIIPGILHEGGVAGQDGYGSGRAVHASVFAGAKRYHQGGLVGGEVPAILKRGEIVLPSAGSLKKASGSSDTVNLRLHDDSGRMAEIADQRIQTASGTIIKVSVVQSAKTVQRQLPGMMANAQVRNG